MLDLMGSSTVVTVLDQGGEKVIGDGVEGIMAVSTRHIRSQLAKDIDADTSSEQGIGEATSP